MINKILISCIAACAALIIPGVVNAKNLSELSDEFGAIHAKGVEANNYAYIKANLKDCIAAFDEWKVSEEAKGASYPEATTKLFSYLITIDDGRNCPVSASPEIFTKLSVWNLKEVTEVENPTFYQELKSNDYKIKGVKLNDNQIVNATIRFKDWDTFKSLLNTDAGQAALKYDRFTRTAYVNALIIKWMSLSTASDISKAISDCAELQGTLVILGVQTNDEAFGKLTQISQILSRKLLAAQAGNLK